MIAKILAVVKEKFSMSYMMRNYITVIETDHGYNLREIDFRHLALCSGKIYFNDQIEALNILKQSVRMKQKECLAEIINQHKDQCNCTC